MATKPAAKRAARTARGSSKKPAPKTKTVASRRAANAAASAGSKADPRFLPVMKAFAETPGFSVMEGKSGAMRGLMLNGRSFGMSSHGRYMLKLDEAHAAELIAKGTGKAFSPAAGRVLKGWIEVVDPNADWVALAKLAHRLALGASKPAKS